MWKVEDKNPDKSYKCSSERKNNEPKMIIRKKTSQLKKYISLSVLRVPEEKKKSKIPTLNDNKDLKKEIL